MPGEPSCEYLSQYAAQLQKWRRSRRLHSACRIAILGLINPTLTRAWTRVCSKIAITPRIVKHKLPQGGVVLSISRIEAGPSVFPPQETELRGGEELRSAGGERFGKVEAISFNEDTVDIKKRQDTAVLHPEAVFAHSHISGQVMADALVRIGEYVADHGLLGEGPYQAARDLLLRERPRVGGQPLHCVGETAVEAAVRLCAHLTGGILAIQGPPGAGKTFTGARMICELVRRGKTVGITANSHKVIRNLIDATIEAADECGAELHCCQKAEEVEEPQHRLSFTRNSEELIAALGASASVGGGTAWLWARWMRSRRSMCWSWMKPRKCRWPTCSRYRRRRRQWF